MTDKVAKLINTQINKEFYSAYLYLEFSNYYASEGLGGFENWYKIQAQEERDHALLFYQYLQNNSIKVTFEAIDKPKCDLKEHIDPLKAALAHEKYVTELINTIYAAALENHDYRTMQLLDCLSKNREKRKKMRQIWLQKWSFSEAT